ncbi:MAG: hypothetical protein E7368_04310 [Clostridiales bacterium]|nr:hypothetical protein [Clostridiales bacterium]
MKKILVSILALMMSLMTCFGLGGCDFLDELLGEGSSSGTQEEEFDRTPYVGTYYFYSYSYDNKQYDIYDVEYKVGQDGITKEFAVLELEANGRYRWYDQIYKTTSYGTWEKSSTENRISFGDMNGVMSYSAEIINGRYTRVDKDSTMRPTKITTWVLIKE